VSALRPVAPDHRAVLVREWDEQLSGSGCCGRLGGVGSELGERATYDHIRADMEAMGAVYRALRAAFPPEVLAVEVVDPRNMVWLVPALVRDARRRGLPGRDVWGLLRRGVRQHAVIVDGALVHPGGTPPDPEAVVAAVRRELSPA
jgi:hypothetical protein